MTTLDLKLLDAKLPITAGSGMVFGMVLGVGIGVLYGHVAIGIAVGAFMGAALEGAYLAYQDRLPLRARRSKKAA